MPRILVPFFVTLIAGISSAAFAQISDASDGPLSSTTFNGLAFRSRPVDSRTATVLEEAVVMRTPGC